MIDITKLYFGRSTPSDQLRYGTDLPKSIHSDSIKSPPTQRRPIVVWCMTRKCNLKCIHCYSDSHAENYPNELSTEEAINLIDMLSEYKAAVLLFSGGEPLLRKDIFELAKYAVNKGIRAVVSSNGTLITPDIAQQIKDSGISYVGISIDGIGADNDKFRGVGGAYDSAINGVRNCVKIGQKVGLRFTMTKSNYKSIPDIFKLADDEGINRICFYHLVYSGRGKIMQDDDIPNEEKPTLIDSIIELTRQRLKDRFIHVLTVDNHTDGVYLYLKLLKENPQQAEEPFKLLSWNGGNRSGLGIAYIDNIGNVHPDQFWQDCNLGNIREREFSEIWEDDSNETMKLLKNRKGHIKGKCGACKYFDICNGNFRVRAIAKYGDPTMPDPACYLSEKEIS